MSKTFRPAGVIPAMITPFTSHGDLNLDGVRVNVEYLVGTGVWGILVCGSTGEAASLTHEEREQVVSAAARAAAGRVKIIAGVGAPSTGEVIRLAQGAHMAGADMLLVVTPYYLIPTQEGLYQHYKTVHDATELPIILYNIPAHTGVDLEIETLQTLADMERVVGLKESSGRCAYLAAAVRAVGDRISILDGGDDNVFPGLALGVAGMIVALAGLAPEQLVAMYRAVRAGNYEEGRRIYYQLLPIAREINVAVNFPAMVKAAVEMLGRPAGPPRKPLLPLNPRAQRQVRQALQASGLL